MMTPTEILRLLTPGENIEALYMRIHNASVTASRNRQPELACDLSTLCQALFTIMQKTSASVRDCGTCRSVLLNGKKLYLLDKKDELRRLGLWAVRLSFTTENPAEIDGVLAAWRGEAHFDPGACTRGLYLRGVE